MSTIEAISRTFSMAEARAVVQDLFQPKPWLYWSNFLFSFAVGFAAYAVSSWLTVLHPAGFPLFLLACVAFYRCALFTHELTHLRRGSFGAFRVVWNLLCGIPFLIPSFTYHTHLDHHIRRTYGTSADGEYLPFGTRRPWLILAYLSENLIVPPLAVFRFLVLSPLGWVNPRIRRFVQSRASSMVIDPQYVRPLPTHDEERLWRLQEAACFFWLVEIGMALMLGLLSWHWLLHAYMTAITIMTLNALRTLVAHRYLGHGGEMTFLEQLLDSVNFPNSRLSAWIWAPVGLRFHALHHLFPAMPYHNLDEANRRLMEQLPHDSAYRQTHCRSLPSAIADLVRNSLAAGRRTTATVAPVSEPQEECSVG